MTKQMSFSVLMFSLLTSLTASAQRGGYPTDEGLFDKPLQSEFRNLPIPADQPNFKRTVQCQSFGEVWVKVIDDGEKGATQISFVSVAGDRKFACEEKNLDQETVISWPGYFLGVKKDLIFLAADDGNTFGGVGFAVYHAKEKRFLFIDGVADEKGKLAFRLISRDSQKLLIKYQRSYLASCSVKEKGEACRREIHQQTGLASTSVQRICAAAYKKNPKNARTALNYEAEAQVPFTSNFNDQIRAGILENEAKANPMINKISEAKRCGAEG